jgi:phenylpropionate dioxygenase-like ring-hydroxylating dioxygenase large terminal subunit
VTPEVARELLRRAVAALRGEPVAWEGELPAEVPVERYLDPDRLAREQQVIRRFPVAVACAAELPRPGSWIARRRAGVPLLIVRQPDGALRAFLNVCRHRGAQVVPDGAGDDARAFACPYHAWTYGADGALRGVPHAEGFPGLDRGASGLRRLAVAERAGLVWVIADPDHARDDAAVAAALGPLLDEVEVLIGPGAVGYAARTLELAASWKLMLDGSFEAYHFKIAHRRTIAAMFTNNVQLVDADGAHRRLYLIKACLDPAAPPPADGFDPRGYGNLIYFFFPATLILVQPDHAQVIVVDPIAPGRTALHEVALIPAPPATAKATAHWDANVELFRRALAEDYELAESIQAGLASGANTVLRFAAFEHAAAAFHAALEAALGSSFTT